MTNGPLDVNQVLAKNPSIREEAVRQALDAERYLRDNGIAHKGYDLALPGQVVRTAGVPRPGGGKRVVRMPGASRRAR